MPLWEHAKETGRKPLELLREGFGTYALEAAWWIAAQEQRAAAVAGVEAAQPSKPVLPGGLRGR